MTLRHDIVELYYATVLRWSLLRYWSTVIGHYYCIDITIITLITLIHYDAIVTTRHYYVPGQYHWLRHYAMLPHYEPLTERRCGMAWRYEKGDTGYYGLVAMSQPEMASIRETW